MNEEKKFGFIEEERNTLLEIKMEMNQENPNEIDKFLFIIENGQISWKPKVKKEEFLDGLKKVSTTKMMIDNIPVKVKEMGKTLLSKGKIDFLAYYSTVEAKDQSGETKTYKFINSVKQLDLWAINPDKVEEDPNDLDVTIID